MMHLRQPLAVPADRPLRVLIQARYSTEEQRQSSLEDQVANCRRFLADNLPPGVGLDRLAIEVVREPEISGELLNRPGINEVWQGIAAGRFEVLVAEESSRLYRHMTFAGQLFNEAVDAGIRILCPTDFIDTLDDDWPERLLTSQSQHSRANYYTRGRIRRAHLGLWDRGAAVSSMRPGYRRRPSKAATATEPAEGPYFDEVDDEQAATVREVFERIAADEPAWAVAEWLTSIVFSKGSHGQQPEWSARNVVALVRRPDYRGEQTFRKKINKQQLTTGRSRRVRNAADKVLRREMPHLRIVSDHVWYEANAAIDRRRTRLSVPTGADHPLTGRARDSRGLLSTIFVCGVCGGPMHAEGRNEGGYRCARARKNECWNRTTCVREQAHAAVLDSVVREVMGLAESREALVARVLELHARGGDVAASQRALELEQGKLTASIANLCLAIEKGGAGMDALVQRLATRERDLKVVQSRLVEVAAQSQQRPPPPTSDEILRHLENLRADLVAGDRRAGVILRQLLHGPIRAIPHRQFNSDKVVLRAEFDLVLSRSLPAAVVAATAADSGGTSPESSLVSRSIVVDLFVPSALARHSVEAHELVETGLPLAKVGEALGISKRQAHLCSGLGAKMAAAGVADPFMRLAERPAKVSRWRASPTPPTADERRAG